MRIIASLALAIALSAATAVQVAAADSAVAEKTGPTYLLAMEGMT
jgi:hypothetical protein